MGEQFHSVKFGPAQTTRDFAPQRGANPGTCLRLIVPFTTTELTKAAMDYAVPCGGLNLQVHVIDAQVVPYPCPLGQPLMNKDFAQRRLRTLFLESGLPGVAEVCYTRDVVEVYRRAVEPGSMVIIATRKRWWQTREQKLACRLLKAGHQVMLLEL